MKKQSGFTLIELAIVLVIIGLLLGGVLKGQELLTQAKIKNVVADLNGISAAYYGYQDRYRAIPGDDGGADERWSTTAVTTTDGVLAGAYNDMNAAPTGAQESNLFWLHLRRAGFVAGEGGMPPNNAVGGVVGVQSGDGGGTGGTVLASTAGDTTTGLGGLIICTSNLPDKIAIAVDTQLDDGNPSTGQVRAQLQTGTPNPDIAADAEPTYAETGSNQYTICKAL